MVNITLPEIHRPPESSVVYDGIVHRRNCVKEGHINNMYLRNAS